MTRSAVALSLALCIWCASAEGEDQKDPSLHPRVKVETTLGDIVLKLDAEKAPISTLNFIQYAEAKYYEGTIFHRVMKTFMIQGGGYTPDLEEKREGLRPGIRNEWKNGLKNVRGTIAMARRGREPDSGTSQFFINVVDNASLDQPRDGAGYAVFGAVVEGMETVDKIRDADVTTNPKYGEGRNAVVPVEPIVVKSVALVGAFDRAKVEAQVKALAEAETEAKRLAQEAAKKDMQAAIDKAEQEASGKAVTTESGLVYVDLKAGEGASPSPTDMVDVHYTGWLLDGTKFDSSVDRGAPASFRLNGVIKGWTEGVGSMKVGGKRRLIIPYDLAYGAAGRPPSIPPAATLVFDVELLAIKPPSPAPANKPQ